MIVYDVSQGEITDGPIRYVTLRADVLMGIARFLPEGATGSFLAALKSSVERHAIGSFEQYRLAGAAEFDYLLDRSMDVAATLGWGRWVRSRNEDGYPVIVVSNSPFAAGFGYSATPVCTAITGALSALFSLQGNGSVVVDEEQCSAQGATTCRFRVGSKL